MRLVDTLALHKSTISVGAVHALQVLLEGQWAVDKETNFIYRVLANNLILRFGDTNKWAPCTTFDLTARFYIIYTKPDELINPVYYPND